MVIDFGKPHNMRWDRAHEAVAFSIWVDGRSLACHVLRDAITGHNADEPTTPEIYLRAAKRCYELFAREAVKKALTRGKQTAEPIVLGREDIPH